MVKHVKHKRPSDRRLALVLQGGGALGAYQAGVYQALREADHGPDWIAGTSIGAINAAIIAGNEPAHQVDRLRDFWQAISSLDIAGADQMPPEFRRGHSLWHAAMAVLGGQTGFFSPRPGMPAGAFIEGEPETAGLYDVSRLRKTLQGLVDFELLNRSGIRVSLGAVHVTSGQMVYFDTTDGPIGAEHVLASGALPPGFPPVRIKGELYWDGGIYSNTPITVVLDDEPREDTLCFMVDLWSPAGEEPRSIIEAETRHKDILYASRSGRHIEEFRQKHNLRRALRDVFDAVPAETCAERHLEGLGMLGCSKTMNIVSLVYPGQPWEMPTKDIDFSASAIRTHWDAGYGDAMSVIERADWLKPVAPHVGVTVHTVRQSG